jgi:hypothetical protein
MWGKIKVIINRGTKTVKRTEKSRNESLLETERCPVNGRNSS